MFRPFLIALQFLTMLPISLPGGMPTPEETGRSLPFYIPAGFLLGGVLCLAALLLQGASPQLAAALLLALWAGITGGLHLDGLADCADAWVGGRGDRERTLALMKDPCCGPMGVLALALLLLIKFTALWTLLSSPALPWHSLLLVPALGRAALAALFLTTPYVRPGGLGSALAAHAPRRAAWLAAALAALAAPALLGARGLWLVAAAILAFFALRTPMCRRIGGATGDCAGALVEIAEAAMLCAAALAQLG
jgi:adenosylcobinamide-GDP ribazoletransferase